MKTKDIIYEAINSVKHEYEPAKYLNIDELTDDNGVISLSVSGIEEGYESEVLDRVLTSINPLLDNVTSEAFGKIGHFWFVGNDCNNDISYNYVARTVSYKTFEWDFGINKVYVDNKKSVESDSRMVAGIIHEILAKEELEDDSNLAYVCNEIKDIIQPTADLIEDEELRDKFKRLALEQAVIETYSHINKEIKYRDYENAVK